MEKYAIIVIGTSAGGILALPELVSQLPAEFPAAVFIVQHLFAESVTSLPRMLSEAGAMPAAHPRDGDLIEAGKIYVARPDFHLLIPQPGIIELTRSARENLHRPAIDPLFRSAARSYGSHTIAVLLTGTKDDGVAGLFAVKLCGGVAIVQDPTDAAFPEMPQNALSQVDEIDYVAPLSEIPALIVECVNRIVGPTGRANLQEESMNVPSTSGGNDIASHPPETLICPECGGALSIKEHGRLVHYECHVGHQFGMESLRYAYGEKTEQTLWAALRALKEQAVLLEQMAGRTPNARLREEYGKQAEESREYADNVKEMLLTMHTPTVPGRL